jgi:2'-5' RNA ligase
MRSGEQILYFALQPPECVALEVEDKLQVLRQRFGLRGVRVPAERLHVSLCGLGVFARPPAGIIETARRAAAALRAPPFQIAFNRIGSWGRGQSARPIVAWGDEGVIGAEALHEALHHALAGAGIRRGVAPQIWPHMTLLRDRASVGETFVAPIGWRVREFVLIASHFGAGHHEILGRFSLPGGAEP